MRHVVLGMATVLLVLAATAEVGRASVLWHNGDFDNNTGLINVRYSNDLNDANRGEADGVFDDFVVFGGGWNITDVYVDVIVPRSPMNFMGADFEIRSGITEGDGGTLVQSGMGLTATYTATGEWQDYVGNDYDRYNILISDLDFSLADGTYWLMVRPVRIDPAGNAVFAFASTTSGANAIGIPAGNNGNSFLYAYGGWYNFSALSIPTSIFRWGSAARHPRSSPPPVRSPACSALA